MNLRCPLCGWVYEPEHEACIRSVSDDAQFVNHVPYHYESNASSGPCDGTNRTPEVADPDKPHEWDGA